MTFWSFEMTMSLFFRIGFADAFTSIAMPHACVLKFDEPPRLER